MRLIRLQNFRQAQNIWCVFSLFGLPNTNKNAFQKCFYQEHLRHRPYSCTCAVFLHIFCFCFKIKMMMEAK